MSDRRPSREWLERAAAAEDGINVTAGNMTPTTDHAERDRLRALCDAATPPYVESGIERRIVADFYEEADREFYAACDPATIRALLDAADERDRLKVRVDELAVEMHAYKSWNRDYDALRAERDRLKAQLFDAQQAILTEGMDANNLRERLQRVVDGYKPLRAVAEQARRDMDEARDTLRSIRDNCDFWPKGTAAAACDRLMHALAALDKALEGSEMGREHRARGAE